MIAADRGDNVVLNKLLDCSKLDLNAKDKDGKTAYDLARMKGHTVVCSRLGLSGSVVDNDDANTDTDTAKKEIVRESESAQNEQSLCVICCNEERTIVLLPCRHLCLCAPCSQHDSLIDCPLCRKQIQHKFSVFS